MPIRTARALSIAGLLVSAVLVPVAVDAQPATRPFGTLREQAHVIDTSVIRPSQLQAHVKSLLSAPVSQLTLVFESFAFKRGIPVDADYVFDVRMLPNPHYEAALRDLTGRDGVIGARDWEGLRAKLDPVLERLG